MPPRNRQSIRFALPSVRSHAVRLAIAMLVGSVIYALFQQSYGGALLLAPGDMLGRLWLWQPLTYGFIETSPIGVIFAALVLWQLGGALEQSWGSRRMVVFAVGTTVLAGVLTAALAFVLRPLVLMTFAGGWVMALSVWVAQGLVLGRAGTNFWGLPISGNVLALIGVGFVFLQGAFYGWILMIPSAIGLVLTALYVRTEGPEWWWLRLQNWRLQRRLRGRSKHLKVVAPDRNTRGDSDRYLH
jgi:membrane associated rhomboid family serine protease